MGKQREDFGMRKGKSGLWNERTVDDGWEKI